MKKKVSKYKNTKVSIDDLIQEERDLLKPSELSLLRKLTRKHKFDSFKRAAHE